MQLCTRCTSSIRTCREKTKLTDDVVEETPPAIFRRIIEAVCTFATELILEDNIFYKM